MALYKYIGFRNKQFELEFFMIVLEDETECYFKMEMW